MLVKHNNKTVRKLFTSVFATQTTEGFQLHTKVLCTTETVNNYSHTSSCVCTHRDGTFRWVMTTGEERYIRSIRSTLW
jgi:hypothetical protein